MADSDDFDTRPLASGGGGDGDDVAPAIPAEGDVAERGSSAADQASRRRLEEDRRELEDRVRQRTAELAKANAKLRVEMDERRRAEEQSRVHQAEIAHIGRLNVLGEMVAELAHELNQPLSAIANYAQASVRMLGKLSDNPPQDVLSALQQIVGQASRAAQIIHRVRKFVAQAEPNREPIDLNVVAAEVVQFAEIEARLAGATIRLERCEQPLLVLADRAQIEQVLINLLHNALEALRQADAFSRQLSIRTAAAGQFVELAVRDTGPGVSPEARERLFERFFTTKPQGMGMGLPISRSIIESHGGRLWLDTAVSPGAEFHFVLPQHSPEST
jgi:C4-dicarboxylate-specific signal transduction histidine kinase